MAPSPDHADRLARLRRALADAGLSGLLALHAVDLLWLAGTRQNAALWVPAAGEPALLVRKSLERAREESAVSDVRPFPPSRELAGALGASGRVGFTFDAVPAAILDFWRRQLPAVEPVDASALLRELRAVKSPAELDAMREAARRLCEVLASVPSFLAPGATELEVAAELERRLRLAGHEGAPRLRAFNAELSGGLVVAGDAAAAPGYFDGPVVGRGLGAAYPMGASRRPIAAGEPVLLDYTLVHRGYVVDMTRTAACGALPPGLARALDVAIRIEEEVRALLRPGVAREAPWERALALATEAGLADRFMGPPGAQARFIGHGVGLELDELPVMAAGAKGVLAAGHVVAVEPKFVFPGLGAVGVEDTFVVTGAGGERLGDLPPGLLRA
jgi:Xaa-Pro aminopeptidase